MGERRSASQSCSVCPPCRMVIDSKGPCTDRSRCLAAVPVIELGGVIPADRIHERIDVHGGLGAIVDVIQMLEHVELAHRRKLGAPPIDATKIICDGICERAAWPLPLSLNGFSAAV